MNYSIIFYILGWICIFQTGFMALPCLVAVIYGEREIIGFLLSMLICLVIGVPLVLRKPKRQIYYTAESMATVSLSWIVLSLTGALPFLLTGSIQNPVAAVFEIASGFTTTGASILPEVESLSHCILFWRSFTHWVGGMGVLVFILSLLPLTGGSHMNLMKAESPGPSVERMLPKVKTTAMILYQIYFAMTVVQIVVLILAGMPVFDAFCIAFGTAGTGGFAITNNSLAAYAPHLQTITAVFCLLFGVNFNVYFLLVMKNFRGAFSSEEPRAYFGIVACAVAIITATTASFYHSAGRALHEAFFQVASIITTTGFGTTDFDLWPSAPKTVLVLLMLIGACAGSTGGGFKVSRLVIAMKNAHKEFKLFLHPNMVCKVKMDGKSVDLSVTRSINIFLVLYVLIFAVSNLLVSLDGYDLVTNFTAVAATFNNIGPGLAMVGPTQNFGFFSNFSKLVLIFDMLAGRLEIFPLMMLFYPPTWRKY